MTKSSVPLMPTEDSSRVGFFEKFAGLAAKLASRAPFFAFCLLLVIFWLVQTTTIITFLMVALLQNSRTRNDQSDPAQAERGRDSLAGLMAHTAARSGSRFLAGQGHARAESRGRPRGEGKHLRQHQRAEAARSERLGAVDPEGRR